LEVKKWEEQKSAWAKKTENVFGWNEIEKAELWKCKKSTKALKPIAKEKQKNALKDQGKDTGVIINPKCRKISKLRRNYTKLNIKLN